MILASCNSGGETQEAERLFVVVIGEVACDEFGPHVVCYCRLVSRDLMSRTVYGQEGETNAFKTGEVTCSLIADEIGLPCGLHRVAQIPYL